MLGLVVVVRIQIPIFWLLQNNFTLRSVVLLFWQALGTRLKVISLISRQHEEKCLRWWRSGFTACFRGYLYRVTLSTSLHCLGSLYNQWREIRTPAPHHSERAYLSLVITEKAQEDEITDFGCSFTLQRVSQLFWFKVSSPSFPYRPLPRDVFCHLHPIQWQAMPQ